MSRQRAVSASNEAIVCCSCCHEAVVSSSGSKNPFCNSMPLSMLDCLSLLCFASSSGSIKRLTLAEGGEFEFDFEARAASWREDSSKAVWKDCFSSQATIASVSASFSALSSRRHWSVSCLTRARSSAWAAKSATHWKFTACLLVQGSCRLERNVQCLGIQ